MKGKFCQSRPKELLSLEVLNLWGVIQPQPLVVPLSSIPDLNGKKGIDFVIEKDELHFSFNAQENLSLRKFPDSVILRFPSRAIPIVPDIFSGAFASFNGVNPERLGRPGIIFFIRNLIKILMRFTGAFRIPEYKAAPAF